MKLRKLLPLSLLVLVISACGGGNSSTPATSSAPAPISESSTIISEQPSQPGSSKEFIDYVHRGDTKLDVDYVDKDFYTDGIGEVTLATKIDGDTAHFYPVVKSTSSEKIKSRFYGIDTPESTGKIQPYGKSASDFTGSKLDNAAKNGTIVISTPGLGYKIPQKDSTGSRYLSLVWISETKKNCPFDELVLLNLWVIQAGFSWINNLEKCPYFEDVFLATEAQSKEFKLNLFSGQPDPHFNYGDYETTSILDIKKEIIACLEDPTHENAFNNKKVRITGTVAGYINKTLYLQCYYTQAEGASKPEGEYAAINIYTGTGVIPTRYTETNAVVMLCGTALTSETFGFQISGVTFPQLKSRESDNTARVVLAPADNTAEYKLHTFEYTLAQMNSMISSRDWSCLFCSVKLTDEVKCTDVYENSDGDEWTLYLNNSSQYSTNLNIYVNFNYRPTPESSVWKKADFLNKNFRVQGIFGYHTFSSGRMSYQITPTCNEDLVCTSL